MNQQQTLKTKFLLVPILLLSLAPSKLVAGGGFSTTTASGNTTNSNLFESKCSVYVSASGKGSGLADGDYFFQVTDTSGDTLLSTDPVSNRRFRVAKGSISAFTGTGGQPHPTSVDENGAVTIGLASGGCPNDFLSNPNSSNPYKVWVMPVGSFSGNPAKVDNPCNGGCSHGFSHSKSKTDNFKIQPGSSATFCLTVQKLFSSDGGRTSFLDTLGWGMTVTDPHGIQLGGITATGPNGSTATLCQLPAGTYTVTEAADGPPPDGCSTQPPNATFPKVFNGATALSVGSPTVSFTWDSSQPANTTISFINELGCFF